MKMHKQLTLAGIIACILGLVIQEPMLNMASCVFITGSMVIKGVKENE